MPVSPPPKLKIAPEVPALFARPIHLLGWQGLTLNTPQDWNLAAYGGDWDRGHLRADDEDGPRLEIRWETPVRLVSGKARPVDVNMPRSVDDFLATLAKQAKREKRAFEILKDVRVLSPKRKRKAKLTNFAWKGDPQGGKVQSGKVSPDALAAQGFGVTWQCETCNRVVLAHILGRANERPGQTQTLASEVLHSLECHGSGGWTTWSVFGLQLEVPEEFRLGRAKLLTGRLELEWRKPPAPGLLAFLRRPERLVVTRLSAANMLLEHENLEEWTARVLRRPDKTRKFDEPEAETVHGHAAMKLSGHLRDVRKRLLYGLGDRLRREPTPPSTIIAWHCPESNKIYALDHEMARINAHVPADVLDSLACH